MKTEDTFHWHIYICSRLCERNIIILSACAGLKTQSLLCRSGLTSSITRVLFLQPGPAAGKLISLLRARLGPLEKHISPLPARFVGKITSLFPARPGPLKMSPLTCWPDPARRKNYLSSAGPVKISNSHKYKHRKYSLNMDIGLIVKFSSIAIQSKRKS